MSMKEVAVYFDVLRQRRDISQPTASPAIAMHRTTILSHKTSMTIAPLYNANQKTCNLICAS